MGLCKVYMHVGVLDIVPKSGFQRRKILDFLHHLQKFPNTPGDYVVKDETLREIQERIVGKYAVTYWFDAPVNIVMVTDIRFAD